MAVPAGTTTTFDLTGVREDLSNLIFSISPVETPAVSNMKKGTATNTFHEWQTDSLSAAALNSHLDGDDSAPNTISATSRLGNYTQILKKTVQVSGTSDAVNKAGRAKELAYQLSKRSKELKRDLEFVVTQNNAADAGPASTAREMAGMETWIASNKDNSSAGTTPATSSGAATTAPTDGSTTRTLTEAMLKTVLASAWDAGGDPTTIMVGSFNKQVASGFSGIATLYRDTAPKVGQAEIIGAADVYVSDFGQLAIVPNRFQRGRTALVLDWEYWKLCALTGRSFKQERLAKTGDSEKRHIVGEYTLESCNEAASGKVADLATS